MELADRHGGQRHQTFGSDTQILNTKHRQGCRNDTPGVVPIVGRSEGCRKWRLLLPGASEPRLTVLPGRTCFRSSYRLRGNRNLSIVVVDNY